MNISGWGKFYAKTFTGSMCGAGTDVFTLMSYCVANALPPDGLVEINVKLLAPIFGCTEDRVQTALDYLLAEDTKSRSLAQGGRRLLKRGAFLYQLVNFSAHRDGTDVEARRQYFRDRMRKRRSENKVVKPCIPACTVHVPHSSDTVTEAEAEAEVQIKKQERAASPPVGVIKEFPNYLNTARMQNKWQVWQTVRRGMKKPKSWLLLFNEQVDFLSGFTEPVAFEILSSSIRNGWQGLFAPREIERKPPPDPDKPDKFDREIERYKVLEAKRQADYGT